MSGPKQNLHPGLTEAASAVGAAGGWTVPGVLGRFMLLCVTAGLALAMLCLTDPAPTEWSLLIFAVLALWAVWLFWRTTLRDHRVPGHVVQLGLAVPVLVLMGHMLRGAQWHPEIRRMSLLADSDTTLLVQLVTLGLLVLLAQDVLSRVRHPQWLLPALGLAVGVGALLRLYTSPGPALSAVAMSGFAGAGMLIASCWLPAPIVPQSARYALLLRLEKFVRILAAVAILALIAVRDERTIAAAVLACCATGATMLLAGAFVARYRVELLASGAMLLTAGLVAAMWTPWPQADWLGQVRFLGVGQQITPAVGVRRGVRAIASLDVHSGLREISVAAGWLGLAAIVLGELTAVVWGLYRIRKASSGDQARAVAWAATAVVAAMAMLAGGGMAVPAVAVVVAVVLGLMPHVMVYPVGHRRGWLALAGFVAVLVVLGLEQRLSYSPWIRPLLKEGDSAGHFAFSLLLAAVLFWQVCPDSWRQAALTAFIAAAIASAGELMQHFLSTRGAQWHDVGWDCLGAATALAILLGLRAIERLQRRLAARPKISREQYFGRRSY